MPHWLQDADSRPVTPGRFAAVRSNRYRTHPHLETLAGFADHGGELVVEKELPLLDRLLGAATKEWLGRRLGWQLVVWATHPGQQPYASPVVESVVVQRRASSPHRHRQEPP